MMKTRKFFSVSSLILGLLLPLNMTTQSALAQEKGKGEIEDFTDDYGEEDSESDSNTNDAAEFFLWVFFQNIGDLAQFWGGTPETAFGPFPSFPYAEGEGFMTKSNDYRSYFFNTEFNYHHLGSNLRSYLFKWETQFVGSSKLSFDLSFYEEVRKNSGDLSERRDHLTFYGVRYGHALYRTSQLIVNLEGGPSWLPQGHVSRRR